MLVAFEDAVDGSPARLVVSGEIDLMGADELFGAARDHLPPPDGAGLRIDLSGVTFMDSMAIRALLRINYLAAPFGGLKLVAPSLAVQRTLEIVGLADHFTTTAM